VVAKLRGTFDESVKEARDKAQAELTIKNKGIKKTKKLIIRTLMLRDQVRGGSVNPSLYLNQAPP